MIPPMFRLLPFLVLSVFCACGCQPRTTLTADEEHLLERLTRDPNVLIVSVERNDDRHLVVLTQQGELIARYILKPDVPGEKTLNIHSVSGSSRLDETPGDPPPLPLRTR